MERAGCFAVRWLEPISSASHRNSGGTDRQLQPFCCSTRANSFFRMKTVGLPFFKEISLHVPFNNSPYVIIFSSYGLVLMVSGKIHEEARQTSKNTIALSGGRSYICKGRRLLLLYPIETFPRILSSFIHPIHSFSSLAPCFWRYSTLIVRHLMTCMHYAALNNFTFKRINKWRINGSFFLY